MGDLLYWVIFCNGRFLVLGVFKHFNDFVNAFHEKGRRGSKLDFSRFKMHQQIRKNDSDLLEAMRRYFE